MTAHDPNATGPTKLAARVAAARKERGMTEKQLAERMHVRQSMISMFESGEDEVGEELAGRLKQWIDSGAGPSAPAKRGPYKDTKTTARSTIKGRE